MLQPQDHDLTSYFELHGHWWRSGADESRVPGCLSFSPDHGLQLQLFGSLEEDLRPPWERRAEGNPIWGEVRAFAGGGVPVSLFDEIATNRPNDPDAEDKPSFHKIFYINRAIVGTHALRPEDLKFTLIEVSVFGLEAFVAMNPLSRQATAAEPEAVSISYLPTEPVVVRLESIRTEMAITSISNEQHEAHDCRSTLKYRHVIRLRPIEPTTFNDYMEMISKIINFLTLCSRNGRYVRRIRGVLNSGEQVAWLAPSLRRRKVRPTLADWLFTLGDIGHEKFSGALNSWLDMERSLGFVSDVFFSELGSPSPYNDARFFHLAGCLEAYHRDVVQRDAGKFIPKLDYKKIAAEITTHVPETLPEALRASIRSALSHANDHAFGERVQELFESLDLQTRSTLAEDQARFLAALKHSRNRMAHVSEGGGKEIFRDREYAHANLILQAWLVTLMLTRCGIPEELIRQRMQSSGYLFWGPFTFNDRDAS